MNSVEIDAIISLAVIGVILMVVLTALFSFLSNYFDEVNTRKDEEFRRKQREKEIDETLLEQAKAHRQNYPIDFAKKLKEDSSDFKVDFNIELGDSIVKTEVVYAE